jgi:pyrrolidone-carboxylate peptidase
MPEWHPLTWCMTENKVLLAGFEKFGPYRYNVAERIISDFDNEVISVAKSTRLRVVGVRLPINFGTFRQTLDRAVKEVKPQITFGIGMDFKDLDALSFELTAHRVPKYGVEIKDTEGVVGSNDQLDTLPELIEIPHREEMTKAVANVIGIEPSENAGRHMCETVLRDLIRLSEDGENFQPGFIHVPHTPDLIANSEKLDKHEKSMPLKQQEEIVRGTILSTSERLFL